MVINIPINHNLPPFCIQWVRWSQFFVNTVGEKLTQTWLPLTSELFISYFLKRWALDEHSAGDVFVFLLQGNEHLTNRPVCLESQCILIACLAATQCEWQVSKCRNYASRNSSADLCRGGRSHHRTLALINQWLMFLGEWQQKVPVALLLATVRYVWTDLRRPSHWLHVYGYLKKDFLCILVFRTHEKVAETSCRRNLDFWACLLAEWMLYCLYFQRDKRTSIIQWRKRSTKWLFYSVLLTRKILWREVASCS